MAAKSIRLRWPARCSACSSDLEAGRTAWWTAESKIVLCDNCHGNCCPSIIPTPADGVRRAGGSARREHRRRAARELAAQQKAAADDARWRHDVYQKRPVLGRLVAALTPKPVVGRQSQATRAWADGALGEEHVAPVLARCAGVRTVHDCRIPGSRANIDHIAIGPSGVFVTRLVDGIERQVEAVRRAVQGPGADLVPVTPVLCFVAAEWPMLRRTQSVRGVIVTWPRALAKLVMTPGALTADDTARYAASVATVLPGA